MHSFISLLTADKDPVLELLHTTPAVARRVRHGGKDALGKTVYSIVGLKTVLIDVSVNLLWKTI